MIKGENCYKYWYILVTTNGNEVKTIDCQRQKTNAFENEETISDKNLNNLASIISIQNYDMITSLLREMRIMKPL